MNTNALFQDIFQYLTWIQEAQDFGTIVMLSEKVNILFNFLFYFLEWGN
jgi:hypothetical protein